jgi:uncharacterized protein (TIGR03435 family)
MTRMSLALAVSLTVCAAAQSFEVASIRTRTDGTGEVYTLKPFRFEFSGPGLLIENFRLSDLITFAYDIKDYELFGEPHWADIDRYNVSVKAGGDAKLTPELARPMMRALLADRFQLKAHHETREIPVYALVPAKGGQKLKESAPEEQSLLTLGSKGKGVVMTVTKGGMAQLAGQFSKRNGVDRPVIDRTGLTGSYDYKLEWGDDAAVRADADAVSIYTAMQEQLGLKLEPAKAPVEVLVVDSAAKPSDN